MKWGVVLITSMLIAGCAAPLILIEAPVSLPPEAIGLLLP